MLTKFLKMNALILVVHFSISIGRSEAMPEFLCLRPPFVSLTKMFNNSFFVIDHRGHYWNTIKEKTVFDSYTQMFSNKTKVHDLRDINVYALQHDKLEKYDLSFKTNFDGRCQMEAERYFVIGRFLNGSLGYRSFFNTEWTKDSLLNTNQSFINAGVLKKASTQLNTKERIKAILDFQSKGYLFIQGNRLLYVYCRIESREGWALTNLTKDKIIFEKNFTINFGEIFGGYVDNKANIVYLFGGQLTSDNSIVRKFVHKCGFETQENGEKSKIKLFCEKLIFKEYCNQKETSKFQTYVRFGLYGAGIILLILVIILGVLICRKKRKDRKKEQSIRPLPKKELAFNRERVIGEPPKRGLARNRTMSFSKKK